ncbi:hypothetical protein [Herpetosiphon giganteus]|uniref:hypothetical protein n=1 Tax=Herpetosiphon giganteus TaxID=2029754 RepID=UPI0019585F8B|nr:hypothetical protein [Herpetosiphon giganteus]MBM7845218.1 arginine exporter protein ArgO [Herpetosiphon giganteus]
MRFDRSWIPAILAVVGLFVIRNQVWTMPNLARVGLVFVGCGFLLWVAWQIWQNRQGSTRFSNSSQVQYWRGQRIEIKPTQSRSSSLRLEPQTIAIIALYGLTGLTGILGALLKLGRFGL